MDEHSDEPSSPAANDPQAPLIAEIEDLKAKLEQVNANFAYYESSNEKLEKRVEEQELELQAKNFELVRLRTNVKTNKKEYEDTHRENVKLRRQSSTFEKIVEANEKESKTC